MTAPDEQMSAVFVPTWVDPATGDVYVLRSLDHRQALDGLCLREQALSTCSWICVLDDGHTVRDGLSHPRRKVEVRAGLAR